MPYPEERTAQDARDLMRRIGLNHAARCVDLNREAYLSVAAGGFCRSVTLHGLASKLVLALEKYKDKTLFRKERRRRATLLELETEVRLHGYAQAALNLGTTPAALSERIRYNRKKLPPNPDLLLLRKELGVDAAAFRVGMKPGNFRLACDLLEEDARDMLEGNPVYD